MPAPFRFLLAFGLLILGAADAAGQAPTLVQFGLSERSTFAETAAPGWMESDLRYFSSTQRHTLCGDCEDGTEPGCADCWWARCDALLAEPLTLRAMKTYVDGLGQPALARHVADRASLTALVYNEPEGTLQRLLPQTRAAWNEIEPRDARDRLIALSRDCSLGGAPPLVFTLVLNNPSDEAVFVTEIVYHRLFDYGEAGGGANASSGLFEPGVDYVHEVPFACEGEETEAITRSLTPPLRLVGEDAVSFELQPIISAGSPDGFLAPIKMRLDIVTSAGTVRTPEFLVESTSCAG